MYSAVGKQVRIPDDDFTFWVDGDGVAQHKGVTRAEAAQKVSEVVQLAEQWLQRFHEPPRRSPATVVTNKRAGRLERELRRESIHCEYCPSIFGSESQVQKHVTEAHVAEATDKSSAALAKPLVRINGQLFERRSLERTKARPQRIAQRVRLSPTVRRPVRCDSCGVTLRSDRLDRHLRDRCPMRNGALPQTTPRSATPRASPERDSGSPRRLKGNTITGSSTAPAPVGKPGSKQLFLEADEESSSPDNYRENRRLDGSRDYWRFREEGRFGSHPSFDACDDESAP